MNFYKSLSTILISFLFSCNQQNETSIEIEDKNLKVIDFTELAVSKTASFNDLTDSIRYVFLQFPDNQYFLTKTDKVVVFDNTIIVLDEMANNIFTFSMEGNFIAKIGSKGTGPGEFIDAADFIIIDDILWVYAKEKKAMIAYDFKGNFLKDFRIDFYAEKVEILDNKYLIWHGGYYDEAGYNLIITNKKGKVLKKAIEFQYGPNAFPFSFTGTIRPNHQNKILYTDATSSEIIEIDRDLNLQKKYFIDFASRQWPEESKYLHNKFFETLSSGEYSFLRNNIMETNDHLVFEYNQSNASKANNPKNAYFFKNENAIYYDDMLQPSLNTQFLSGPINYFEDFFISYLKVNEISKLELSDQDTSSVSIFNKIKNMNNVTDEPAQLLVFYKLKAQL
jgi:hypothetical protein